MKVTAPTQAACNNLPNQQYHQTVLSGSGSGFSYGIKIWQCTDIPGFREAVASCLPMKPGQGLGECPALAAAAQKYGTRCLNLTFFQGGGPQSRPMRVARI